MEGAESTHPRFRVDVLDQWKHAPSRRASVEQSDSAVEIFRIIGSAQLASSCCCLLFVLAETKIVKAEGRQAMPRLVPGTLLSQRLHKTI